MTSTARFFAIATVTSKFATILTTVGFPTTMRSYIQIIHFPRERYNRFGPQQVRHSGYGPTMNALRYSNKFDPGFLGFETK